jgi:hypothetical protein
MMVTPPATTVAPLTAPLSTPDTPALLQDPLAQQFAVIVLSLAQSNVMMVTLPPPTDVQPLAESLLATCVLPPDSPAPEIQINLIPLLLSAVMAL